MAKGISIGVASDTKAFSQGIKSGVIEPLDGVKDALKDVVDAGDKAGSELDRSFAGQQQQTKELRRDYQRTSDSIIEDSRRVARESRQTTTETSRHSKESVKEIGNEARQNAAETFSSFDGSVSSLADGIQGTLGGIVGSIGPLGAVLGAAGAAGIGLISTAMQSAADQAAAFKQKVSDLTTAMLDSGKAGQVSFGYVVDELKTLAAETDDTQDSLLKLDKLADKAGVSFKDFADGSAGSTKALNRALQQTHDEQDKLYDKLKQGDGINAGINKAEQKRLTNLGLVNAQLVDAKKANDAAAKSAKLFAEAGGPELEAKADATEAYSSAVQSAYADAGSAVSDYVKNGKFDLDGYQKALEANAKAIVDYQSNMATAVAELAKGGHDQAIQYLEQLGPDAAPLIAAFIKAPEAQKKSLESTWDTLGAAASSSFGTSLQSNLNASPATKRVKLLADTADIDQKINALRNTKVTIAVGTNTPLGSGVRIP